VPSLTADHLANTYCCCCSPEIYAWHDRLCSIRRAKIIYYQGIGVYEVSSSAFQGWVASSLFDFWGASRLFLTSVAVQCSPEAASLLLLASLLCHNRIASVRCLLLSDEPVESQLEAVAGGWWGLQRMCLSGEGACAVPHLGVGGEGVGLKGGQGGKHGS
jgi:hypothetical protein